MPEALIGERVIPRFVDSYVVENGRHALQVHASLYRDLLALLQREALLALTVQALSEMCFEPGEGKRSKPRPMLQKDAAIFRRKFLNALARQQKWTAGDSLDFQSDLQMYEKLIGRNCGRGAIANHSKQRIIRSWIARHFCWIRHSWKKLASRRAVRWATWKILPRTVAGFLLGHKRAP